MKTNKLNGFKMTKKLNSIFYSLILVEVSLISCSVGSDSDSYNEDRVNETKTRIMNIANNYGLQFEADEAGIAKHIDEINEDSLNVFFSALASAKGRYHLVSSQQDDHYELKQIRAARRKTLSNTREYSFPDYSYGGQTFYCDIKYGYANSKLVFFEGNGGIKVSNAYLITQECYISGYTNLYGTLIISGILYAYYWDIGRVVFYADGTFNGANSTGNSITWY